MYEKDQLREYVEKFALNYLQLLVHPNPPSVLFGADKDTGNKAGPCMAGGQPMNVGCCPWGAVLSVASWWVRSPLQCWHQSQPGADGCSPLGDRRKEICAHSRGEFLGISGPWLGFAREPALLWLALQPRCAGSRLLLP